METEAKYTVADGDSLRRLLDIGELDDYRVLPAKEQSVIDTYYDTAARDLLQAGYALRYRDGDGHTLVSLKEIGAADEGIHRRQEYEVEVPTNAPPADWPESEARALVLSRIDSTPLEALLMLRQDRVKRMLQREDRTVGELSLDIVENQADDRVTVSYEIEVELKDAGTEEDLERIARLLGAYAVTPQPRSKFERALELIDRNIPGSSRAAERWGEANELLDGSEWLEDEAPDRPAASPGPEETVLPIPPEPDEDAAPLTIDQMLSRYRVDRSHARHVAAMATALFDRLPEVHGLAPSRRNLLETAALLHNVGLALDPDHHHTAGRDLIQQQRIQGLSDEDRAIVACTTRFHRKTVKPGKEAIMQSFAPEVRRETLALSALLRVADAFDYSVTQTSRLVSAELKDGRVLIILDGPHAVEEARRAEQKADLWAEVFGVPIQVRAEGHADGGYADGGHADGGHADGGHADGGPAGEGPAGEGPAGEGPAGEGPAAEAPVEAPDDAGVSAVPPSKKGPGVTVVDSMTEAGRKILAFHYGRMRANEAGTIEGVDIEALHDMRVATRRMRAAIRLFRPFLPRKEIRRLEAGLRRTARLLGGVRDLDVIVAKARQYRDGRPEPELPSLEPLFRQWGRERESARKRMIRYLEGADYARFKRRFERFLRSATEVGPAYHPKLGAAPDPHGEQVRHTAPALIWEHYQRVRSYESILDGAAIETLHALRIDCKRLRYALEFLNEPMGRRAAALIAGVTRAQDHLGDMHDADVAAGLLRGLLDESSRRKTGKGLKPDEVDAIARYREACGAVVERAMRDLPAVWEYLISSEFRQALGEATSSL